jgi:hypothetical protein
VDIQIPEISKIAQDNLINWVGLPLLMAETVQELRKLLRITRRASKKNGTYVDSFGYDYCISSSPMYTDLVQDCVASVLLSTPCCALIHRFWEQGSSRQSPLNTFPR